MRKVETGMYFYGDDGAYNAACYSRCKSKSVEQKDDHRLKHGFAGIRFAPTKLKKHFKVKVSVKNKKVLKAKAKRKKVYLPEGQSRWQDHHDNPIV